MNRRLTQVALAAAAALTFSLAAPVAAHADQSAAFAGGSTTTSAAPASTVAPSASLAKFALRHSVITRRGDNTVTGTIAIAPTVQGGQFRAEVRVNGTYKGLVDLYSGGFYYRGTWGPGAVRLGPVHYVDPSGTPRVDAQYSNYFRVRQAVRWSNSPITKRGSKITFKLRGFKTFNGSSWVSAKTVKLQVRKGKKWKNLRNVKLNKSGSAVVKLKHKKKRYYRVYIPTTTRIKGAATGGRKI